MKRKTGKTGKTKTGKTGKTKTGKTLKTLETLETVEISLGSTPLINSGDMQLTTLMNNGHH